MVLADGQVSSFLLAAVQLVVVVVELQAVAVDVVTYSPAVVVVVAAEAAVGVHCALASYKPGFGPATVVVGAVAWLWFKVSTIR